MFTPRRFILLILIFASLVITVQAARVYGSIYEWSDLEKPLKNVIVEIEENASRVQYKVSSDGTYSFEIAPGIYLLKAKYYVNNILEYSVEEKLLINRSDESRNLDLLLFPPTDPDFEHLGDINLTSVLEPKEPVIADYTVVIIVVLALAFSILFFLRTKKRKPIIPEQIVNPLELSEDTVKPFEDNTVKPVEKLIIKPIEEKTIELPEDLRELYDMIIKKGGRTTQKEIRKEARYGEAKVSLMLADLEDRGLVKKIKKGRSNIIIAENIK